MTDMEKSRLKEQQIIGSSKRAESSLPVKDVYRQGRFSERHALQVARQGLGFCHVG